MIKYLDKSEFYKTYDLALECFHDEEFLDEFYASDIKNCNVAVKYVDGEIVSMAMIKTVNFNYDSKASDLSSYIFMVCTGEQFRPRGYMNDVLNFIFSTIVTDTAFLIPVNPNIYSHLGFVYSWQFNESERDFLYADDGLYTCYAKILKEMEFVTPDGIS